MSTPTYPGPRNNLPVVAIIAAVAFVALVAWVVVERDADPDRLITIVALAIPTLLGAAFAERASKDIRNGTVAEKAREGATAALNETGAAVAREGAHQAITERGAEVARQGATQAIEDAQVVTRTGPVVTAEMRALTAILERLTTHAEATPPTSTTSPADEGS